ncbi:MAG: HlyD family efflux transporter periplasmic adaptor subunit [Clostridia bacterium]|nr:HlyD family efflux transporter periplasmic adaptor subunit [Clostridia bacterium]
MKKWWIFVLAAAVACVGIGAVSASSEKTVQVKTVHLQPQKVEQTVICNGMVEAADSVGVFVTTSCVLGEVTARKGTFVKAGQVLARVDKEATRLAGLASAPQDALALAAMPDTLTAPEDGVVVKVEGQTGQTVEGGTPCVVMAPRSSLQVRIAIREKQLRSLKEGMKVRVTGAGFAGKSYDGVLTEIAGTANTDGMETVVEGVVTLQEEQTDDSLRLGLTAKAAVIVSSTKDGLVVPYEAVREDENGKEYVYILENGIAIRRILSVKSELADGLLLKDSALSGAEVVLQPDLVPADGAAVLADGKETA